AAPGCAHAARALLPAQEDGTDVDGEDLVEDLDGRLDEGDLGRDAGDADEHVRCGAEPLVDVGEGRGDLVRVREIARKVTEGTPSAQPLGLVTVAQVEPGHDRALTAEHRGHALADAARGAGDDHAGSFQTIVCYACSSRNSRTHALGCQFSPISLPSGSSTAWPSLVTSALNGSSMPATSSW